ADERPGLGLGPSRDVDGADDAGEREQVVANLLERQPCARGRARASLRAYRFARALGLPRRLVPGARPTGPGRAGLIERVRRCARLPEPCLAVAHGLERRGVLRLDRLDLALE